MNNKILVKVKHYRSLEIRTQYFFDSHSPFISMNPYRDMIQRLDEKDLFIRGNINSDPLTADQFQ